MVCINRRTIIVSGSAALVLGSYYSAVSTGSETLFALYTFAIMFCIGGDFTLFLPITMELFGEAHAGQNYGLIFAFYTIFSVLNIVVLSGMGVAFNVASALMGGLTFLGFVNMWFFSIHAKTYDETATKRNLRTSILSGKHAQLHHLNH